MSEWTINLFGKFHIRRNDMVVAELEARKAQELLCYLLLHRSHSHPREGLASLLWPNYSSSQSKSYLRKTLWQLQTCLSPSPHSHSHFLDVDTDSVRASLQADIWLDVAVFEHAYAQVKGVRGRNLDPSQAELLRQATGLYRGDLLEGWYEDWCLFDRERLQAMYLTMLDKLAGHCEAHLLYEEGILYGTQILRFEQAQERAHQRLMRLHYLAGDRTAALRQFERCVAALASELRVEPDQATLALYEQIRANRLEPEGPTVPDMAKFGPRASTPLYTVLSRLRHFHAVLEDVQRQIQEDIRSVEEALKTNT